MKRPFGRPLAVVLLAGWIAGCAGSRDTTPAERLETAAIVDALEQEGLTLQAQGPVSQPFLSTSGQEYQTLGGTLQIFEYRSLASAVLDAGRLDDRHTNAFSPPHIYHRDNIIVVYFGDDQSVTNALATVLGNRVG